jgi:hypothetical protein
MPIQQCKLPLEGKGLSIQIIVPNFSDQVIFLMKNQNQYLMVWDLNKNNEVFAYDITKFESYMTSSEESLGYAIVDDQTILNIKDGFFT